MAKKRNSNNDKKEAVMVGAGLAALAAGAYFFLGPQGKKHQKNMKGWMVKMKGEVLEKLEDAKDVTEPIYNDIVDTVARANKVAGKIPQAEISALARDLKRQWRTINRSIKGQKPARRKRSTSKKSKTSSATTTSSASTKRKSK